LKLSVTISGLSRMFGADLAAILDVARGVDEAGVDQLVLPDHVLMGTRLDRYPGPRSPGSSRSRRWRRSRARPSGCGSRPAS